MTSRWDAAMRAALAEAAKCGEDVPVGAVIVDSEKELHNAPPGHAAIVAIREAAGAPGSGRLDDLTLVVTLEPCVMCAGAIVAARIPRVVFGAWDSRVGASGSLYDLLRDGRLGTPVEVISGVLETECAEVLTQFFESRRMSGSK